LYDGCGTVIHGKVLRLIPDQVQIRILDRTRHPETGIPLTLVQAMLKGKKMDLLIQKATELGVQTLRPVTSRYCEKKNHNTRTAQRWQRIMLEACKQCGRPVPMTIHAPAALNTLSCDEASNLIMPWEAEDSRPLSPALLTTSLPTVLLIGPEGGFHPDEVTFARDLGFATVSLGPRILRAETAALTATAIVQYLSHNLNPAAVNK
jgi:16S rRNA (uracil1498-N3)-methyltransferase